jgi:hypothetical protein
VTTWPLIGRDNELEHIGALLRARSTGGVVVSGPAGVGKTRLSREAAALATELGDATIWVRATRSAASLPLGAFGSLLAFNERGAAGSGADVLASARGRCSRRRATGR